MQHKFDLLVVSDCVLDLYYRVDSLPVRVNDAIEADKTWFSPGGACTVAIVASRLGLRVGVIDRLGNDCFSSILIRELQANKVYTEMLKIDERYNTSISNNIFDRNRRHAFLGYAGAGAMLDENDVTDVSSARAIFFDGYNLKKTIPASRAIINAAMIASRNLASVFFDPGPRKTSMTNNLVTFSDTVFFNKKELLSYTRKNYRESKADLIDQRRTYVIKEGATGSTCISEGKVYHAKAFRINGFEHTIGAGDVFDATYIALTMQGVGIKKACLYANLMASIKLKSGTINDLPSLGLLIKMGKELGIE
ncbi:MAG: carbohydrate kinase family protein [Nitrososphaerota archaeon]|jgi:ribokinase|nr:carbohydrate kinase family protein [Nitrososphaerota archaeon]MDG6926857.1 carbohydrate kinase family protein [Nitrososphaerota archaeon]MDG6930025.1 carbohydrate kinase family protein [Nitrososphaerota archaeon]MDG6931976.1 carbohydrate kinase family protein [Nitrososphaerota archaeon]MDG6943821.1 carbohydrate kinase family protein [Nitrososphaerota archaeon]